ncbi:glycosyltransferase [bacterium]|nr:glycosyltransferase [bacterium]
MKKMLFLTDGFGRGGAESKLLELLRHLDTDKYNITVACFVDQGLLRDEYFNLAHRTIIIPRDPAKRFDLSLLLRLYKHMRKERYDVLQTMLFLPDIVGSITGFAARIPLRLAWETASHHNPEYLIPLRRRMYRFAIKFMNRIITVSRESKKSIIYWHPKAENKLQVIHYGIDLDIWHNPAPDEKRLKKIEFGVENASAVIGVVARFYEVKGHVYLIEALNLIKQKYPRLKCLLIGEEGGTLERCKSLVASYELESVVKFHDSRDDIPEVLKMFDIFVLPSISEGLPNVILEAMACGVPVVASNTGGIPELVADGESGVLFVPQDPASLAESLQILLDDSQKSSQMGVEGRRRVETLFSLRHQIDSFEKLYNCKKWEL